VQTLAFSPADDQKVFAQIPAAPGVFALRGGPGEEPYISKAADMRRRIMRLLAPPESQSKRLNLRERCRTIEFASTGSDFENVICLYRLLKREFPETYSKRLRLNLSTLVRIHWENPYPRAYLTRKLGALNKKSIYYGPFASRVLAEKLLNDSLDLFKSRRCTFELNPDPAFPGCVYSEMKMCLAPCFKGCTDAEYMAEMQRVEAFFDSCGESLIKELEAEREAASANLEFEQAASIHTKVEKVKSIARSFDEITRRLDRLDVVVVQPSAELDSVSLFRFVGGEIVGPISFSVLGMLPAVANAQSGDSSLYGQPIMLQPVPESGGSSELSHTERLQAAIDSLSPPAKVSTQTFAEELAILKRWYFRSHRLGEAFLRNEKGEWPLRRVLNGVSRVACVLPSVKSKG
jgi:excinuclease ABC subunit C